MPNEIEIAEFIVERVNASQKIFGANLGSLLDAKFTGWREDFGKLRPFVQKFCVGRVKIVGLQGGGDPIYAPASSAEAAFDVPRPTQREESPWHAFATPGNSNKLFVNSETGEIRIERSEEPEPPSPWVKISQVSSEDHRNIANAFRSQIAPDDLEYFQTIPEASDFWPKWSQLIKNFADGKYSKPWASFRFNKLCELYLQRLKSLNIDDNTAAGSLDRIKAVKTANYRASNKLSQGSPVPQQSAISLRHVVRATLDSLSEDELRRIWLPLGLVADALRKKHTDSQ
jgi:hypothetical protein